MRNLVIGYIVFVTLFATIWVSILPSQEDLMIRLAEGKIGAAIKAMETSITSRYLTVDMEGNVTHMIYTYHNATITGWELMPNQTTMVIYFNVTKLHRVKRFGSVIDEYTGTPEQKSALAHLEGDIWRLDIQSIKDV